MSVDLTAQIYQYLTTAPSSLFAQQPVEMLAHWQGDANLLWRVSCGEQQAVVKLFLDAGQARSRRQFDAHQIFAPVGLAPKPLWADRYPHGLSRQLIVYRWCDGEVMAPSDSGALLAWSEAVASLHASPRERVRRFSPHPVNLDYYWRIEQVTLAQIEAWLSTSGLALTAYFRELSIATETLVSAGLPLWESELPTPIHGDLTLQHALIERGQTLMLDWEMFGLGDPALDVARLLQHESQVLTQAQVDSWLVRYIELMDQPTIDKRIALFRRLLEVHNVVYLLAGLQQYSEDGLNNDLRANMPFMQEALSTSLGRANEALMLEDTPDAGQIVEDFVTWLTSATPSTSGEHAI